VRTQLFFCGEAGPRAPRCPLKLTERAGPNGSESHAVACPWGYLGTHTSGPPYCQADKSSNKHSRASDPQSIEISASKEKTTCPIPVTPCQRRSSVPRWQPYRPVPRPGIALCDTCVNSRLCQGMEVLSRNERGPLMWRVHTRCLVSWVSMCKTGCHEPLSREISVFPAEGARSDWPSRKMDR